MGRTTKWSVALLVWAWCAVPPAGAGEDTVEGFGRLVSAASQGTYASNRGVRVASAWEYAVKGEQAVVWQSAALPGEVSGQSLTLVWSCGMSRQRGPHSLTVNGLPCVDFFSGVPDSAEAWRQGECSLRFEPTLIDDAGDVHGIMRLSLPSAGLTPGQPVGLRVTGQAGGGGAWFMLHEFTDSEVHARTSLVALPSGRRLLVAPPRPFFVAPQAVAWDCPLVLGGPAGPVPDDEVTVTARLMDAQGGAEQARQSRAVRLSGQQPRVRLELWPCARVPEGEHLLEVSVTGAGGAPLGIWRGAIGVRHLAEVNASLEQAEEALGRLERDGRLTGVQRDVVLPTLTWAPVRLRQQIASWATQAELDAGVGSVGAAVQQLAADVAALQQGHDPLAGRTGLQWRAYRSEHDGRLQPYAVYVPAGFRADRAYPLVVMLHGFSGEPMGSASLVVGLSPDSAAARPGSDYLVVAPYDRDNIGYTSPIGEEDVWRVIADVERQYPVDGNRVYLTGLSMGGTGTLHLGLRYADRFAAIAAVCGASDWRVWNRDGQPVSAARRRVLDAVNNLSHADNAANLPVRLVHGAADSVVLAEHSRVLAARLGELGYRVEYEELPGVGHSSWTEAYRDGRIFACFGQYCRDPYPQRVVHVTACPRRYGRSYWTRTDALLEPNVQGRLEARRLDAGRITVATRNVAAFRLDLRPPVAQAGAPLTVEIDGRVCFAGPAPDSLAFRRIDESFAVDPAPVPPPLIPFGGLGQVLDDWHCFIYGTGGSPEENEAMRAAAAEMAAVRGPVDIAWTVVADTAAASAAGCGARVFVGCPRTNRALAALGDVLPARVAPDGIELAGRRLAGADLLLTMVRPDPQAPGQCLAVVAGTGPEAYRAVSALGWAVPDYAVVRPDGTVVTEGLFDAAWQPVSVAP